MFAPIDYYSWQDIREASPDWANVILASKLPTDIQEAILEKPDSSLRHALCVGLGEHDLVRSVAEAEFLANLLERFLVVHFMDCFTTTLCSPTGLVTRAEVPALMHADRFDYFYWSWPKYDQHEFRNYFQHFREGNFGIADVDARFLAIEYSTGLIKLKNNTYSEYKMCSNYDGTELELRQDIDNFVVPFRGWSVCWSPESLPETTAEMLVGIGFDDLTPLLEKRQAISQGLVHENGNDDVLKCLLEAYPDGKGRTTWSEVERRSGYSRRHITRMLKRARRYDDWIAGKTEAS